MTNASEDRIKYIVSMATDYGIARTAEMFGITNSTVERYIRAAGESGETKKVLLFDIETAPMEVYAWQPWKVDIPPAMIKRDWSVLCWAAKWLDKPDIMECASWQLGKDVYDDKACMATLHALISEADIIVAHNGDKFDIKRINTRFLLHGMQPPRPSKSIDTLKIARKKFAITHNKLDYIGGFLGVGHKVKHEGMDMWKSVLAGDASAQKRMLHYNVGDVVLLEEVYRALAPWDSSHSPIFKDYTVKRCTVCAHPHLRRDGEVYTPVSTFAAYQCCKCGHWMRGKVNLKENDEMNQTTRNAI